MKHTSPSIGVIKILNSFPISNRKDIMQIKVSKTSIFNLQNDISKQVLSEIKLAPWYNIQNYSSPQPCQFILNNKNHSLIGQERTYPYFFIYILFFSKV